TLVEEEVTEVRAEEAGAPRDDGSRHGRMVLTRSNGVSRSLRSLCFRKLGVRTARERERQEERPREDRRVDDAPRGRRQVVVDLELRRPVGEEHREDAEERDGSRHHGGLATLTEPRQDREAREERHEQE